jgi:hypothetical protein
MGSLRAFETFSRLRRNQEDGDVSWRGQTRAGFEGGPQFRRSSSGPRSSLDLGVIVRRPERARGQNQQRCEQPRRGNRMVSLCPGCITSQAIIADDPFALNIFALGRVRPSRDSNESRLPRARNDRTSKGAGSCCTIQRISALRCSWRWRFFPSSFAPRTRSE